MTEKLKKILLIKLSSLGDVIFNIPLAHILKNNEYKVTWLVSEKGFSIVQNNPCVDEAVLLPVEKWKKSKNIFKNLQECVEILHRLRKENFDICLDTQMRLKSLFWTRFCGAKRRIISKSAKEFSVLGGNEYIPEFTHLHAVEKYLEYASYLGLDTSDIKFSLPKSSEEVVKSVDNLLYGSDHSKPIIMIAPATTWKGKHWSRALWKKLVERFDNRYNIIFTGTKNDIELINYIRDEKHINLAGKTNLNELIELLRRAYLVISLDSGTTHLARATEKPKILSIFCCTPMDFYAPLGAKNKYLSVQNSVCKPCHHKKCSDRSHPYICTTSPDVESVWMMVKRLLA